jgi:hypothetical protein
LVRCMPSSGFSISSRRSLPIRASHRLNGSALGEGIDWMVLNTVSVSASISQVIFTVRSLHFQVVTFCNHLTSFLLQPIFENFPITPGIGASGKHFDNVNNAEKPFLLILVPMAADMLSFEDGDLG